MDIVSGETYRKNWCCGRPEGEGGGGTEFGQGNPEGPEIWCCDGEAEGKG